jgi:RNA polymerase sigma factor (sigma-70 family)
MSREQERRMLLELADCRARLLQATRRRDGSDWGSTVGDAEFPQVVCDLAGAGTTRDPHTAALRAVARRHQEIRTALADLIQDGFCGLLLAIDRFDPSITTRLASYAVWWIRQAMPQTIAGRAYPVRLNPKQLRRLLREIAPCPALPAASHHANGDRSATTWRDLAAIRPRVPLDASGRSDGSSDSRKKSDLRAESGLNLTVAARRRGDFAICPNQCADPPLGSGPKRIPRWTAVDADGPRIKSERRGTPATGNAGLPGGSASWSRRCHGFGRAQGTQPDTE